jgi:hypothetical protein
MKLPRFRFTVRRMMVAVALLAIILEGSIVWVRYSSSRARAEMITAQVGYLRGLAAKAPTPKAVIRGLVLGVRPGTPPVPATGETIAEWTDYLETLARKADRESRRPWLPVEPDPPFPK